MVKTKSFKDLIVWQKAYKLVIETYKITKNFLNNEIIENLLKEVGSMLYCMVNPKRYPLNAIRYNTEAL